MLFLIVISMNITNLLPDTAIDVVESDKVNDYIKLAWVFGCALESNAVVHDISTNSTYRIFYHVANIGIVFNVQDNTQMLLQGHQGIIACASVSSNKKLIVTAESEYDCMIIVWDSELYLPLTSFTANLYNGIYACSFLYNNNFIAILTNSLPQKLCIWDWVSNGKMNESNTGSAIATDIAPIYTSDIEAKCKHNCISFSTIDSSLFMSNNTEEVLFWRVANKTLSSYAPSMKTTDVSYFGIGALIQSVFLNSATMAITGTSSGHVILWNTEQDTDSLYSRQYMKKIFKIYNAPISFISTIQEYIVAGYQDGVIHFFNYSFKLLAWFEDIRAGPIVSIAFRTSDIPLESSTEEKQTILTKKSGHKFQSDYTDELDIPDFTVSTSKPVILSVLFKSFYKPAELESKILVQGYSQTITSLAVHPQLPQLAIGGHSGSLYLCDYKAHRIVSLTCFPKFQINCMAFDHKADWLVLGSTSGTVSFLQASTLVEIQSHKLTSSLITHLLFSLDSTMLATADILGYVSIYYYTHKAHNSTKPMEWVYIGRYKSHISAVTKLQFYANYRTNLEDSNPGKITESLYSLGTDKRFIEYALHPMHAEIGLQVSSATLLPLSVPPTTFVITNRAVIDKSYLPSVEPEQGIDYLLIATQDYKLIIYSKSNEIKYLRTVLGPTYGQFVHQLIPVIVDNVITRFIYSTKHSIIGSIMSPLEGDPSLNIGVYAHAGAITCMCVSYDYQYVFTSGGSDLAVCQWQLNHNAPILKPNVQNYISLIEGGAEGKFMCSIVDYFYYAQIRAQGEETTKKRKIKLTIPFSQIPNLMRSLGYYPSQLDIQHLTYEVSTQLVSTNKPIDDVEVHFKDFIKLFVNHRPAVGVTKADIAEAFECIKAHTNKSETLTEGINKEVLFSMLIEQGESIPQEELDQCLQCLLGENITEEWLFEDFTLKSFEGGLLGFEE